MKETAYFALGCFWGAERRFWQTEGVLETSVGYMGGNVKNPSYELVCTGTTNHAEAVKVIFDPSKVSYRQLLEMFWTIHDPTQGNRQGNDIGSQYRSVIFYENESQKQEAEITKNIYEEAIKKEGFGSITTQIIPSKDHEYFEAEEYHQKYLKKNPNGYDCHARTGVFFPSMV
ncbi:MAG: peptide-methionine (S)-S-oxide reductase MsrA [Candidatus Nanopelagicales bacterium]